MTQETITTMREKRENGTMPVILCTAYPISSQEAVAMGADDMVIKSSELLDLKVKIKKAVFSDN
jgi:CheY-like chemotaxis protein